MKSRPIPGHAKIVSVKIAPAINPGSESAMIVTTGMSAFFKPCLKRITLNESPFAAAVRM